MKGRYLGHWAMAAVLSAGLLAPAAAQDPGQGGDAGSVVPEKEQPAILAQAAAAAGKFRGYTGQFNMSISDAKTDASVSASGTIHLKKKSDMMVVLEDLEVFTDPSTARRTIITPGKKVVTLKVEPKTGEELDISKAKTLDVWMVLSKPLASLSKDFSIKLIAVSGRYAHQKNAYTNMGGDMRKEFKDPAEGKKPGFDAWTCHKYELTPKNATWAAQVKKIYVSADMTHHFVTRVEFDHKGDGTRTSNVAVSEIELDAKFDDKLLDTKEFAITKVEPQKEEKK